MPTSSQSQILSVVDYQLLQQQPHQQLLTSNSQDVTVNLSDPIGAGKSSTTESKRDAKEKFNQLKEYAKVENAFDEDNASSSDNEHPYNDTEINAERRTSILNEYARRLLILGTIRPSKTFYKDLPEADVEHLMEYFRRMRIAHRKLTSEEINEELQTKFVEYKPKMFFDSTTVTKNQVINIEKLMAQYADKIRANEVELTKLENPMRFVIKQINSDALLTTLPREYNDCFLALVTRTDPLRKSDLVTELVRDKLLEDIKANSLDISYFPGGVNYDMPHDEIDENGQMKLETYQKLKKRLQNRKVWYFSEPPEKRASALLAIPHSDSSISVTHQRLLDALHDRLKSIAADDRNSCTGAIFSIEFIPLSCVLNSYDIQNQFIVECDSIETKEKLIGRPLKIVVNKQSVEVELLSYDEIMQKEYNKAIKAEKYRELVKSHDQAVKRAMSHKQ